MRYTDATAANACSFNPLEAGFSSGQGPTVCSTSGYYCAGGMDLASCAGELATTCGTSGAASLATTNAGNTFGDSCKGHAMPYHFHVDLVCEYSPSSAANTAAAHSPLIGLALDGRGIYGVWEGAGGALPTLDACNGHIGPVPGTASVAVGSATSGITGLAASSVYHYHTSTTYPFTLGCYSGGTAQTYAQCTALYPNTCNSYIPAFDGSGNMYYFDDWCPCRTASGGEPASAVNAVPTTAGAKCYTATTGNSQPPTSLPTTSCSTTALAAAHSAAAGLRGVVAAVAAAVAAAAL